MPTFIRLTDYKDSDTKEQQFANPTNRHTANQDDFSKIPGSPIAYWVSEKIKKIYSDSKSLGNLTTCRAGMTTGDNDRFLRSWFEIENSKFGRQFFNRQQTLNSVEKWFPFNKGSSARNWYGNNELLVNWQNDGIEIRNNTDENGRIRSTVPSQDYYFKKGLTWSTLSNVFSVRFFPEGYLFDTKGSCLFDVENIEYILGLLNTKIVADLLKIITPTLDFNAGYVAKIPVVETSYPEQYQNIQDTVKNCIAISREEWDSRETSWDFKYNELIRHKTDDGKIVSAFSAYCDYWREKFHRLHANEEELNRLFIEIYGLQDELTPDVALEDITILKSESRIENGELVFNADEIARQFISYAVGCMFGRYTLDREGLVVANMGQGYPTDTPFAIDDDNIIPVLEEEVFADDIAARFERFAAVAFGEEKVAENLRWIEEALEMNIRKYFYGEFYKDHVKRYKKRPIYWLIQSPKKGFSALIYMHRYQSDTMARVQTMYLREYLTKLSSLIEHHNTIVANPSSSAKEAKDAAKLASKLEAKHRDALDFDRGDMSRIAAEQIVIDLDDGVKVNYQKFKGVLPDIGLAKGEE